eukprot:TRINITY_DN2595_c0_g1_i2.p1 TRINITY_DN2595_c0_g1~~TRINITY_DN2595_c0_g1_i2.p1  ORF type:complete len:1057 (+),score=249.30 TRINITY_DN2595_c0_g1_i2:86-3256(+)
MMQVSVFLAVLATAVSSSDVVTQLVGSVKELDYEKTSELLAGSDLPSGKRILVNSGVGDDYNGIRHPTVIRPLYPKGDRFTTIKTAIVEVLQPRSVTSSTHFHTEGGATVEVSSEVSFDSVGNAHLSIYLETSVITESGVLRVTVNDEDALLIPVFNEVWNCAAATSACRLHDHRCALQSHIACINDWFIVDDSIDRSAKGDITDTVFEDQINAGQSAEDVVNANSELSAEMKDEILEKIKKDFGTDVERLEDDPTRGLFPDIPGIDAFETTDFEREIMTLQSKVAVNEAVGEVSKEEAAAAAAVPASVASPPTKSHSLQSAPELIADYMYRHGAGVVQLVELPLSKGETRPWFHLTFTDADLPGVGGIVASFVDESGSVHPVEVSSLTTTDGVTTANIRVNSEDITLLIVEGVLIIDRSSRSSSLTNMAFVAHKPVKAEPVEDGEGQLKLFGWLVPDRTWTATGCIQVDDEWLNTVGGINRPLDRATVKVSSSLFWGLFAPWGVTLTNVNGCYSISKTFTGIFANNNRDVRALVKFENGLTTVNNPFEVALWPTWGFFVLENTGTGPNWAWNMGTRVLNGGSASQANPLTSEVRRRQGLTFWGYTHLQDAIWGQGGSLMAFNQYFKLNYPMFNGGVALDFGLKVIFIGEDVWDVTTAFHEAAHIWHYEHLTGSFFPMIISDLISGCSTHNCQEQPHIAFLEGFAEYAAHRILCGDVYNSNSCWTRVRGFTLELLREHPTCINPSTCLGVTTVEPGLVNLWRLIRKDDGCQHALHLLTDDLFYTRNFQAAWPSSNWVPQGVPVSALKPECQWYSNLDYNLFNVLRGFLPVAGYSSYVPASLNILQFYSRFMNVNNVPVGFMQDRFRYMNPNEPQNPWTYCRNPCPNPAIWYNGPLQGWWDTANCYLMPLPLGGYVASNAYYVPATPGGCPAGTFAGAFPGCRALTLTPGSYPGGNFFGLQTISGGAAAVAWWTGAGSCPVGVQLFSLPFGSLKLCKVMDAPAGTILFIYSTFYVHSTNLPGTCTIGTLDSNGCKIGTPPAGTTAFSWGGNFYHSGQ